jgi:hypothetical protein
MSGKPTITNLKARDAKLLKKPFSRTNLAKKPRTLGLASGLTKSAIESFELAKKQQQEQAVVD